MAEEKYISKVRIGNEDFTIRDKAALAAAAEAKQAADRAQATADGITVPVTGVTDDITFKDANGKMFKLKLEDKNVKLVAVTYNVPTIILNDFKWNNSNATSYKIDQLSTGSVDGAVAGTLIVTNGKTPTCNVQGVTITKSGSSYILGGTVSIANKSSKSFTFTTEGATLNPSTNKYDTATTPAVTISRTSKIASGWAVNAAAVQPESNTTGGFKFNINSTAVTPDEKAFGDNKTVELIPSTAGYIYIFTNGAKSFVMSTDKETVDSAKLGGGIVNLGTATTYSTRETYYVYRSKDPCVASTKVYVKAIV